MVNTLLIIVNPTSISLRWIPPKHARKWKLHSCQIKCCHKWTKESYKPVQETLLKSNRKLKCSKSTMESAIEVYIFLTRLNHSPGIWELFINSCLSCTIICQMVVKFEFRHVFTFSNCWSFSPKILNKQFVPAGIHTFLYSLNSKNVSGYH